MIGPMLQTRGRKSPRLLAAVVVWAAAVAGTACSDGNEPSTELGQYALVSINGESLPYTFSNTQGGTVVVESASVSLASDAAGTTSYTATVLGTTNGEAGAIFSDAGTYSRSGSSITFTSAGPQAAVYVGTVGDNQLTITVPAAIISTGATGTITLDLRK